MSLFRIASSKKSPTSKPVYCDCAKCKAVSNPVLMYFWERAENGLVYEFITVLGFAHLLDLGLKDGETGETKVVEVKSISKKRDTKDLVKRPQRDGNWRDHRSRAKARNKNRK